jgi:hypothetical protein
MVRLFPIFSVLLICVCVLQVLSAEPGESQVERALAMQQAMATARILMNENRSGEAVEVLEKQLLYANGNRNYLGLLRDAYIGHLKNLQLHQGSSEKIEQVRRQLKILDPEGKAQEQLVSITEAPIDPMKPDQLPPIKPVSQEEPNKETQDDPFQQTPLDRAKEDFKAKALAAFDQKQYIEANQLFKQASQQEELSSQEKSAWGYCKLYEASSKLNQSKDKNLPLSAIEQEVQLGLQLGGEKLNDWGKEVLTEIAKRKQSQPASTTGTIPNGWQVVETANFRILHKEMKEFATETARIAELARTAMFERWSGPTESKWVPKCDIWLHPTGEEYSQATQQSATSPGHSSVTLRGSKVAARRIDLRADIQETLDVIIPHEVTYVVIHDLFSDQQIPRWAEVAMTVLSEPPSQVARYLRAVPRMHQEKRLFPVSKLMSMTDFPDDASSTPFFVESVSLVNYLVKLKGAKAFTLFLQEAPRRGFENCLQRHYGFKDANELQDKWLKHAMGQ